jgi:apolipoprotein D and lipocalin family protein
MSHTKTRRHEEKTGEDVSHEDTKARRGRGGEDGSHEGEEESAHKRAFFYLTFVGLAVHLELVLKECLMRRAFFRRAGLIIFVVVLASCANAPSTKHIPAVSSIDFELFEGAWYEIARIPIPIARDWVGTTDTYVRNADGTWLVLYEGYKGGFDGKKGVMTQKLKVLDASVAGEMSARPFPLIWLPYRLVYWNAADLTMLVTSGTMDYLWIMAKDPIPVDAIYEGLVEEARLLGFDISRLEKVPQRKADTF